MRPSSLVSLSSRCRWLQSLSSSSSSSSSSSLSSSLSRPSSWLPSARPLFCGWPRSNETETTGARMSRTTTTTAACLGTTMTKTRASATATTTEHIRSSTPLTSSSLSSVSSSSSFNGRLYQRRRHSPRYSYSLPTSLLSSETSTRQKEEEEEDGGKNHKALTPPAPEPPRSEARSFLLEIGYDPPVADGIIDALVESGVPRSADGSDLALLAVLKSMAGRWEVGEDEGLEDLAGSVRQELARREGREVISIWVVPPTAWDSGELRRDDDDESASTLCAGSRSLRYETPDQLRAAMARAFRVECLEGTTLTDVARFGTLEGSSTLGEYLECSCSGIMACSTCHVVVDPRWFATSPKEQRRGVEDKAGGHGGEDGVHEDDKEKEEGRWEGGPVQPPCEAEMDMLDLAFGTRETSRLGCQIVLTKEMDGMVVRVPGGRNNLMDFVPFAE